MDKVIKLNDKEYEALIKYFDNTTINISSMIKKQGLTVTKSFESAIDKIYLINKK